jgi:hypothetical protein
MLGNGLSKHSYLVTNAHRTLGKPVGVVFTPRSSKNYLRRMKRVVTWRNLTTIYQKVYSIFLLTTSLQRPAAKTINYS